MSNEVNDKLRESIGCGAGMAVALIFAALVTASIAAGMFFGAAWGVLGVAASLLLFGVVFYVTVVRNARRLKGEDHE